MRNFLLVSLIAISAAACSKHKATCEKYVDWSMKCDKDSSLKGDEQDQAKTMLTQMCIAAYDDEYAGATGDSKKMMEEMYAHITSVATCAEKANSCEDYAKCEAAAKDK